MVCAFDNQLNSGKDGKLMLTLTDGLLKMMNFNMFSAGICLSCFCSVYLPRDAADTLLVLGDSLSAAIAWRPTPPGLRCSTISGRQNAGG
jgi:hypothetical protein